jgi:hypothetical protein
MLAELIGPDLIIFYLALSLVGGVATSIDAVRLPRAAFRAARQFRIFWVVAPLVGVFICGIGAIVLALVWTIAVRSKVIAAARG